MESNEKNMKIRRSFDRRKNPKKQQKQRRTTSIFYYDHGEGGGNINEKSKLETDIASDPEDCLNNTVPVTPIKIPLSADNTNNSISKINIFNFNKKSSSNSSNSSITTISTTSTSSLHFTLSINSELSDDTLSPTENIDITELFPTTPTTPSTANTVFDENELNCQFDEATITPLIGDSEKISCDVNSTVDDSTKFNYVQQLTLRFENLCKNSNSTNNNNNSECVDGPYQYKRKSSIIGQRKRSLTGHFGKIFPWIHLNSDDQNRIHEVPSDEEQPYKIKISDCEEIFEDKNIKEKKIKDKIKYRNNNNSEKNDKQNKKSVKFDQQVSVQSLSEILVPEIYVNEFTENCYLIDNNDNDDDDNKQINKKNNNKKKRKDGKFKNRSGLYRSLDRPKTEIYEAKNNNVLIKSHSYHPDTSDNQDEPPFGGEGAKSLNCYEEINSAAIQDLRKQLDFSFSSNDDVPPIIEELLRTEEKYVNNLRQSIENYGGIFDSDDIPIGLKGKKFVLFGNIEQIFEFHETILLPMLQNNRNDLKKMFDEFLILMEENHFYAYIIYTMNKKKSLKLSEQFTPYFKELQQKLDDKLGISSFLVQPIQRLARYPLLLQEFYKTCFGDIKYKQAIASCCKLEKKIRILLNTVNECEEVNDIVDCFDLDVYYQGQFKKVNEFSIYDHTVKRNYRSKVFIFDKCLIYTEIKDKRLIYRGYYPCEVIGFVAKSKTSFTLYYEKRKRQECDFEADSNLIELWIDLIRDMIKQYAIDEKKKLQEIYATKNNHLTSNNNNNDIYRQNSELLYRNSNRISADSGISGMQTPVLVPEESSPTTTWYDTM